MSPKAVIEAGVVILPGAIVNMGCRIGSGRIINIGAAIDFVIIPILECKRIGRERAAILRFTCLY